MRFRTSSGSIICIGNIELSDLLKLFISDNFSFQNNGIKKVHMLENNAFSLENNGFFKAMFLTLLHT